jgi:hypothetical protein
MLKINPNSRQSIQRQQQRPKVHEIRTKNDNKGGSCLPIRVFHEPGIKDIEQGRIGGQSDSVVVEQIEKAILKRVS